MKWLSRLTVNQLFQVRVLVEPPFGALEKRLTHCPFKATFTGSNPVRVTIRKIIARAVSRAARIRFLPDRPDRFVSNRRKEKLTATLVIENEGP